MTTRVSKILTAVNQEVTIWCEGMSKVGISIRSVTGTPTLSFYGSTDGVSFNVISVGAYPSASPPATRVTEVTAAGSYEVPVANYKFIRTQMTEGAGPATVVMAASTDGGYQEAFLSDAQGVSQAVLYPSTTSSAGVNTMTIPAQANRAINLTFLEVSQTGPGAGGGAQLRIWDGAVNNGSPLYSCYITTPVGSVGTVQKINLPTDEDGKVGIQGTPGNVMTVQVINLGGVTAICNARVTFK